MSKRVRTDDMDDMPSLKKRRTATPPPTVIVPKDMSADQARIFSFIAENLTLSVVISGDGGAGKTFLLNKLIPHLRDTMRRTVAVCAPTGVAAQNIPRATTIHKFAGLQAKPTTADEFVANVNKYFRAPWAKAIVRRWKTTQDLVIEEMSMVSAAFLDKLDQIARRFRGRMNEPFGGMRLILCGDFFQLPPVDRDDRSGFAFKSKVWAELAPRIFNMSYSHRQKDDPVYAQMLALMRRGELNPDIERALDACVGRQFPADAHVSYIFPHNNDVDDKNNEELKKIPRMERVFVADDWPLAVTAEEKQKSPLKDMRIPARLVLKIGAQVMLLNNMDVERGLVNGSVGIVRGFVDQNKRRARLAKETQMRWKEKVFQGGQSMNTEEIDMVLEHADNGKADKEIKQEDDGEEDGIGHPIVDFGDSLISNVTIPMGRFEVYNADGKIIASRDQYPLVLAYAMSIHKSQGQTIRNYVIADMKRIFEAGMGYVLLSRLLSLALLSLTSKPKGPWSSVIYANAQVKEFYAHAS